MQMLRPDERTLDQRSTAARIFVCLEGSGTTIVDGMELNWGRNDVIVVPGWAWFSHRNGAADSVLYSVTDAPGTARARPSGGGSHITQRRGRPHPRRTALIEESPGLRPGRCYQASRPIRWIRRSATDLRIGMPCASSPRYSR